MHHRLTAHVYFTNLEKMQMDTAFFRSFFTENGRLSKPPRITPSTFDDNMPVVVAELNHHEAGELLAVSKVKGGNRMVTSYLRAMRVVFFPDEGRCTVWVIIYESASHWEMTVIKSVVVSHFELQLVVLLFARCLSLRNVRIISIVPIG